MSQVTIAYAEADFANAALLARRLKDQAGAAAHLQDLDRKAPRESNAYPTVLLWSRAAARAVKPASPAPSRLILARLDDAPRPTPLRAAHSVALTGWRGERSHRGFTALLKAVAAPTHAAAAPRADDYSPHAKKEPIAMSNATTIPTRTPGLWAVFGFMALTAAGITYAAGFWTVETLQALPSLLISQ